MSERETPSAKSFADYASEVKGKDYRKFTLKAKVRCAKG